MGQLYVFGHKNPDSDAICASIAYAALKSAQEGEIFLKDVLSRKKQVLPLIMQVAEEL